MSAGEGDALGLGAAVEPATAAAPAKPLLSDLFEGQSTESAEVSLRFLVNNQDAGVLLGVSGWRLGPWREQQSGVTCQAPRTLAPRDLGAIARHIGF